MPFTRTSFRRRPSLGLVALLVTLAGGACTERTPVGPARPAETAAKAGTACLTSASSWLNASFTPQTDTFTAQFDATPGGSAIDGVMGLSGAAATDYSSLAAIVRFNTGGTIDARNGGAYSAASTIPYRQGASYHIRLAVKVAAHTYSAYVTPAGGVEAPIGIGYAFRAEQSTVASLADLGTLTSTGSTTVCSLTVTSAPVVASVLVTPATASLTAGATVQLTATPRDATGTAIGGQAVTWTSANPAVATVSATGMVTGVGAGNVAVTASSAGVSGNATVTVTVPPAGGGTCSPTGSGVCRYVDGAAGSDANPGTSAQPFKTLQAAANRVNPGDVVVVRTGVYTGGSIILNLTRSGTSGHWIVFQAETKWGAVLNGQNNASAIGIEIKGSYIRVQGFEVTGTSHYGIEAYGGHDVQVAQAHVHDIGHYCTDTSGGIVGINAYAPNLLIEQSQLHDIGRWANGQNGCTTTTAYWQNHDHGVYVGQGDNVVIRNNVFYNFTRGWAIQRYDGGGTVVHGLAIVNNTFVGANPNKVGQIILATATTNLLIANNIFYQPNTAGIWLDASGLSGAISHNLAFGAPVTYSDGLVNALLSVLGSLPNVNPLFLNLTANDFRLQAGSPAINAGTTLSNVPNDFRGTLRPPGPAFDVGAYEMQ